MLPKKDRIRYRLESEFFTHAREWNCIWGRWRYRLEETGVGAKVAIIVPKKFVAQAVARHRAKRRVASVLAEFYPTWPAGEYVLSLNQEAVQISQAQMRADMAFFAHQRLGAQSEAPAGAKCDKIADIDTREER